MRHAGGGCDSRGSLTRMRVPSTYAVLRLQDEYAYVLQRPEARRVVIGSLLVALIVLYFVLPLSEARLDATRTSSSGGHASDRSIREPGRQPSLRLFRLFGIQFTANWSWLLLLALLVYVAYSTFRGLRLGFSPVELWLLALVAALLSVASLYGHELAHALVARAFGIPVRTISLFLLGGMAHITRESPTPRAEFLIAVVGPAAEPGGRAGRRARRAGACGTSRRRWPSLGLWLATMNIPLAIFNLVPAYPLDGGRVLRAVLWFAGRGPALGQHGCRAGRAGRRGRPAVLGRVDPVRRQQRGAGRPVADHDRLVHVRRRGQLAVRHDVPGVAAAADGRLGDGPRLRAGPGRASRSRPSPRSTCSRSRRRLGAARATPCIATTTWSGC